MNRDRSGITMWEIVLFTLFLAVAGGASVFFFFLNSDDVKGAQKKIVWIQNVNNVLDAMAEEIANSICFEHPFNGASGECFFRAAGDSASLQPVEVEEGFAFSENTLNYVVRNAAASTGLKRFGKFSNPLISGCREGKFIRVSSDRLDIMFRAEAPDGSSQMQNFHRIINLRNQ